MRNGSENSMPPGERPDREVIRRVLDGAVDEFAGIVGRHGPRIYAMVARRVRDADVDAVAQEVFVSAFRSLASYDARQPLEHWLARIARRRCCDYWREEERKGRRGEVSFEEAEGGVLARSLAGAAVHERAGESRRSDAVEKVQRALARLDPASRALIEGAYFEEVPLKEMAATLGWSLVNTKVRAFRARHRLKKILEELETEEGG